jgi:hypothetical protein
VLVSTHFCILSPSGNVANGKLFYVFEITSERLFISAPELLWFSPPAQIFKKQEHKP